jgi:hypothetical protein
MKKFLPLALAATLLLSLPSISMARVRHHKVSGEVTAVNSTTLTITENTREGTKVVTVFVPKGTPIDGSTDGSALSGLVGKHVAVREASPGTASDIHTKGHKAPKSAASS